MTTITQTQNQASFRSELSSIKTNPRETITQTTKTTSKNTQHAQTQKI
jgi:hypothetical protein